MFNKEPKMVLSENYKNWRDVIFSTNAEKVGVSSGGPKKVYGMVMDIGMIDQRGNESFALSTTVFASGEASFVPTPGGGFFGLGGDPRVAEVAKSIVTMGQIFLAKAQPAKEYPLPAVGQVAFYFLTTSGVFVTVDKLSVFQSGPYSQLLNKFGQIRGVAERMIDQRKK
ncbi:MAG: hypothetical protein AABZ00_16765 [Chloroflexota bacterium]|jgi:hypothetical protein